MSIKFTEIRTLRSDDLQALCIRENWYTQGCNREYDNLLAMTKKRILLQKIFSKWL